MLSGCRDVGLDLFAVARIMAEAAEGVWQRCTPAGTSTGLAADASHAADSSALALEMASVFQMAIVIRVAGVSDASRGEPVDRARHDRRLHPLAARQPQAREAVAQRTPSRVLRGVAPDPPAAASQLADRDLADGVQEMSRSELVVGQLRLLAPRLAEVVASSIDESERRWRAHAWLMMPRSRVASACARRRPRRRGAPRPWP